MTNDQTRLQILEAEAAEAALTLAELRREIAIAKADLFLAKLTKAHEEYTALANGVFAINDEYLAAEKAYCEAKGDDFYDAPYLNPAGFSVIIGKP